MQFALSQFWSLGKNAEQPWHRMIT
jgi:hypothetical protein